MEKYKKCSTCGNNIKTDNGTDKCYHCSKKKIIPKCIICNCNIKSDNGSGKCYNCFHKKTKTISTIDDTLCVELKPKKKVKVSELSEGNTLDLNDYDEEGNKIVKEEVNVVDDTKGVILQPKKKK
jgi:hypothetical protein